MAGTEEEVGYDTVQKETIDPSGSKKKILLSTTINRCSPRGTLLGCSNLEDLTICFLGWFVPRAWSFFGLMRYLT
jgi:hypothetical protein